MDTASVEIPLGVSTDAAVPASPTRSELIAAERRSRRRRRVIPQLFGWLGVLMLVAMLWPASWGGVTGLTVVQGNSMLPTYKTGDLIVSIRWFSYQPGDVISFVVPDGQSGAGGRVIHRVTERDELGRMRTHGDGNLTPDPWLIEDVDVMGKAVLQIPGAGAWFGGNSQWLILAAAAGLAVTILLWPSKAPEQATRARRTTADSQSDVDADSAGDPVR